jgi:hypothetical protein
MRGIAIPWSKCNIFQKKTIYFIFYLKKKSKNQTLNWLASQPVYGAKGGLCHPRFSSRPPRVGFGGGPGHLRLAFGVAKPPPETTLGVVVATPDSWWSATHGFSFLFFFFVF